MLSEAGYCARNSTGLLRLGVCKFNYDSPRLDQTTGYRADHRNLPKFNTTPKISWLLNSLFFPFIEALHLIVAIKEFQGRSNRSKIQSKQNDTMMMKCQNGRLRIVFCACDLLWLTEHRRRRSLTLPEQKKSVCRVESNLLRLLLLGWSGTISSTLGISSFVFNVVFYVEFPFFRFKMRTSQIKINLWSQGRFSIL